MRLYGEARDQHREAPEEQAQWRGGQGRQVGVRR